LANNGLEDVGDRALDTLLDSIVLHPQLRTARFTFPTLPIPLKDFDEAEIVKWDSYNVYTMVV